jgi:hypothetical protein
MKKIKIIAVTVALAMASCFALVSLVEAGSANNCPTWSIFVDGTDRSVKWERHKPNPRFAIYDPGTPEDSEDDLVLDLETCLVWERSPDDTTSTWFNAMPHCYWRELGNRYGCRLPTIEELASLVDDSKGPPSLPAGHPFINAQSAYYWSSTTDVSIGSTHAWGVDFNDGSAGRHNRGFSYYVWCVRGGPGHDGY